MPESNGKQNTGPESFPPVEQENQYKNFHLVNNLQRIKQKSAKEEKP